MKKIVIAAILASFVAAPVAAAMKAQVAERDSRGRPTKVVVDGQTYDVCTSDDSDGCINPREAGLTFGNTPVKKWPGRPISREN
jgi:Ni/Co efflux regulator RcnB